MPSKRKKSLDPEHIRRMQAGRDAKRARISEHTEIIGNTESSTPSEKKSAGGPRRSDAGATPATALKKNTQKDVETPVKRGRGRPKSVANSFASANGTTDDLDEPLTSKTLIKKSPAKGTTRLQTKGDMAVVDKPKRGRPLGGKSKVQNEKQGEQAAEAARKRAQKNAAAVNGRSPTKKITKAHQDDWEDGMSKDIGDDEEERPIPVTQYWLMKAEPESRIEKGMEVKFSIDDLASRKNPEPWDGVRNPAARNHMRAMRKGDLAFFYHSNCKTPGIVGVMEIVQEHSIDQSAFDPNHPYYDPKSDKTKPRWEVVHVEFRQKFPKIIPLSTLKETPELAKLQMLRQGRLSVSSVQPEEWELVLSMVADEKAPKDVAALQAPTAEVGEITHADNDEGVGEGPGEETQQEMATEQLNADVVAAQELIESAG